MTGPVFNVECQKCARVVNSNFTKLDGMFKNLRVCLRCYEPYADAVKPKRPPMGEGQGVPNARPRQLNTSTNVFGPTWDQDWELWNNDFSLGKWEDIF